VIDRPGILPSAYTETYDGGNDVSILLRQWPVIGVSSCVVDGVAIPPSPPLVGGASAQIGYVLDSSGAAPPGTMQRMSLRGFLFTCGIQNVVISYSAGYQITNESVVIPTTPPYSVPAQDPYGDWASDAGVAYSNGVSLTAATGNLAAGQYAVVNGVYSFAQPDAGSTVLLTYGYVPADLASCCMDWAAERYAYRSRIGQHSKSLGGQETMAFIVKDIPDFAVAALSPYRRVVMP
ncbi:MAG: phage head-tail connector protein, partial [Methylocella sp.]